MTVIINDLEVVVAAPDETTTPQQQDSQVPEYSHQALTPSEMSNVFRHLEERALRVYAH